jgi:hypothetical protein
MLPRPRVVSGQKIKFEIATNCIIRQLWSHMSMALKLRVCNGTAAYFKNVNNCLNTNIYSDLETSVVDVIKLFCP